MAGDGHIPGSRDKGAWPSFLKPNEIAFLFQCQMKVSEIGLQGSLHNACGKRSHHENDRRKVTRRGYIIWKKITAVSRALGNTGGASKSSTNNSHTCEELRREMGRWAGGLLSPSH